MDEMGKRLQEYCRWNAHTFIFWLVVGHSNSQVIQQKTGKY